MGKIAPLSPEARRWLVAIAVMSSAVMEVLDTSVVNVSLPHIAGSLSASVDEATWVLTSYLIANAVILPISGWLANILGRKRLLLTVVSGFTISSVLCGLAPSLGALIFFRVLQGTTGGGLQPLSQAVLLEEFPPEERGKAMAFWGLGIVAAPILGPTLGGWITDTYSWRWVFYINVPIGIFSLIMISLFLYDPPHIRRGKLRVDLWGLGMLAVGMARAANHAGQRPGGGLVRSHFIVVLAVIAAVVLTAFVIRELLTPHPSCVSGCCATGALPPASFWPSYWDSCCTAAWCCCRFSCRRCWGGRPRRRACGPVRAGLATAAVHAAGGLSSGQGLGCPLDAGVRVRCAGSPFSATPA